LVPGGEPCSMELLAHASTVFSSTTFILILKVVITQFPFCAGISPSCSLNVV
jgi:hypothetical protein